ncbi:MAG: CDP-alcohol phosphatidyltransferase family protein, partial [Candidatus Poseidoniaceae archaeon]|nr:CDP-alcohol phosphatidyltransferase family protein [Candidatus Poseidoniaceae archaeon]
MALEQLRKRWESIASPLVSGLGRTNPAVLTWLALPIGVAASFLAFTAPKSDTGALMLIGAALLITFSMILDGLDGQLARQTGQVTRWGDYLDHTLDRLLDAMWVIAIASSPAWVDDPVLGWAAAWFTLLGSYMGTQAQAVSGGRNYRGFSRADRTILTIAALALTGIFWLIGVQDYSSAPLPFDHLEMNPLSVIVIVSGLGGIYTFFVRYSQARKEIIALDQEQPLAQPNQD